jgi:hypothetical protein
VKLGDVDDGRAFADAADGEGGKGAAAEVETDHITVKFNGLGAEFFCVGVNHVGVAAVFGEILLTQLFDFLFSHNNLQTNCAKFSWSLVPSVTDTVAENCSNCHD